MRIATWNVNGLRARLPLLVRWLEARAPDVVGLQELKLTDEQFPHDVVRDIGYVAVAHGQKAWNGVAVLARLPLQATLLQAGLPGRDASGARLVTARVADLTFTSVYVPNGKDTDHPDFAQKLAWLDALVRHLAEHHAPARPGVMCGDFNICPAPIDSWNEAALAGTIFHTLDERDRFRRLLDWGLCDLFRERNPGARAFSWWDYRAGAFHRNQGLRLDFLLGTEPLLARVRSVTIDRDYRKKQDELTPSDHAPVWADLD